MPKTGKSENVKLEGRISIETGGEELRRFVLRKLESGMSKSDFVRNAAEIYFKYETGTLWNESLRKALLEVLPAVLQGLNLKPAALESAPAIESRPPAPPGITPDKLTKLVPEVNLADLAKIGVKTEAEMEKILEELGVSSLDEALEILQSIGGGSYGFN
ncbi:MAG: hypothetical protein ACM3YE_01630 [Bacteroidota bacterium]